MVAEATFLLIKIQVLYQLSYPTERERESNPRYHYCSNH